MIKLKLKDRLLSAVAITFVIVVALFWIKASIDDSTYKAFIKEYKQAVSNNSFMVHALGGIDGHTYTNSKEALEESSVNGVVFYEADVRLTSDGKLVLVHGWSEEDYQERIGVLHSESKKEMSYDEFMGIKIQDKYTPLSFENLVDFMRDHPDVYVLLDFGRKDASYLRKAYLEMLNITRDDSILNRMIVGGHNTEMIETVRSVYDFKLLNLYWPAADERTDERIDMKEEFLNFCRQNRITSISTATTTYDEDMKTIWYFRENGLIVYLFTENDEEKAEEYLNWVNMVGTDFLKPKLDGNDY